MQKKPQVAGRFECQRHAGSQRCSGGVEVGAGHFCDSLDEEDDMHTHRG